MSGSVDRSAPSRTVGTQTLDRGLRALQAVATARDGLSIAEVAEHLGVHRSIASRLLATLADHRVVVRGPDGRYRAGAGLTALAGGIHATLRAAADPVMAELAERLGATIALLVVDGADAVALAVAEPPAASYVLSFKTGGRHSLEAGSAGVALRAARPATDRDPADVVEARRRGYAATFGEVEPGAYGVAVPIEVDGLPPACLNLITHRAELAESSPTALLEAADRVRRAMA